MAHNQSETETTVLLNQAADGDADALHELFSHHRSRLKQMVRVRLNRQLRGRVDDSDVLQEAFLEVSRKLPDYLNNPLFPFYLWLRQITGQKLNDLHRKHLGAQKRDAGREVTLHGGAIPPASSASLAAQLLGKLTSPSQAAIKAEMRMQLQGALNSMDPIDREVLTLRHFEQLGNADTARVLDIDVSAASNRYVRALKRLKTVLNKTPGFPPE